MKRGALLNSAQKGEEGEGRGGQAGVLPNVFTVYSSFAIRAIMVKNYIVEL